MMNDYINQDKSLLYKFMPFNLFALETIINNTLYFCKPNMLNDPLDCEFKLEILNIERFNQKTINCIKNSRPVFNEKINFSTKNIELLHNQDLQKKFISEYFNFDFNENYGVCSFSQTVEENLLWSHYADRAKGICIVFNKEKLISSININLRNTYYSITHDYVRYKGVKNLSCELTRKSELRYTYKHFFSKTKHWSYEKEYRIVLSKKRKRLMQLNYPYVFGNIVPFDKDAIHSIILGERIDWQNCNMIKKIIESMDLNIIVLRHTFDKLN